MTDDLPQLRQLLWSRTAPEVSEEEACELYATKRGWVDPETMTEHERRFFDDLVTRHGKDVFLG